MSKVNREIQLIELIDVNANICFNFLKRKKNNLPYILDITEDHFENKDFSSYFIYSIVIADIVTCATLEMKEKILLHTEVDAILVEASLEDLLEEPDTKNDNHDTLNILWYGEIRDIFSFKKDIIENKDLVENKQLAMAYTTEPKKKLERLIDKADIIYLPKTYTTISECSRLKKAVECLKKGKFVIAAQLPYNFSHLVFDGSLKEGIDFYKQSDVTEWIATKQKAFSSRCQREIINAHNSTKLKRA